MEHLLILFVEEMSKHAPGFFHRVDKPFQRRIDRVVPDLEELLTRPDLALDRDIVIPAKSRLGTGLVIGVPFGLLLGLLVLSIADQERAFKGAEAGFVWFAVSAAIFGLFLTLVFARFPTRGTMVLTRSGVTCTFGKKQAVTAPWPFFSSEFEAVWLSGPAKFVVPIDKHYLKELQEYEKGKLVARGWDVNTSFFSPWPERGPPMTDAPGRAWEVLMKDNYRCPLKELVFLLQTIASKLRSVGK